MLEDMDTKNLSNYEIGKNATNWYPRHCHTYVVGSYLSWNLCILIMLYKCKNRSLKDKQILRVKMF